MGPKQRREVGQKIANLVVEAEKRFPPGEGKSKAAWVARQAAKQVPRGQGASAEMGKWLGAFLLRVGIEIAVATLQRVREDLTEEGGS